MIWTVARNRNAIHIRCIGAEGKIRSKPMETGMYKHIIAVAAALAVLSLGALTAQAGNGAQGSPSRYNSNIGKTSFHSSITEFSSSSARTSGPRR